MTHSVPDAASVDRLSRLPILTPDPRRAERTRLRCRAVLTRRVRRTRTPARRDVLRSRIAAAAAGTLGVVYALYIASLFTTTIGLLRAGL
jgi:hypothetical protein